MNKGAVQSLDATQVDQHFYFCYKGKTFPLLPKSLVVTKCIRNTIDNYSFSCWLFG